MKSDKSGTQEADIRKTELLAAGKASTSGWKEKTNDSSETNESL